MRKLAAFLDIDQAILSKIERGKRKLKKEQVIKLAQYFDYSEKKMLTKFLCEQIMYEVGDEEYAKDALMAAEKIINYRKYKTYNSKELIEIMAGVFSKFSKVMKAWTFGSFSRENDSFESDIDIAIKTDKEFSYFDLAEIQYHLENVTKRNIDIGFIDSFKPKILNTIKPDLHLIYER